MHDGAPRPATRQAGVGAPRFLGRCACKHIERMQQQGSGLQQQRAQLPNWSSDCSRSAYSRLTGAAWPRVTCAVPVGLEFEKLGGQPFFPCSRTLLLGSCTVARTCCGWGLCTGGRKPWLCQQRPRVRSGVTQGLDCGEVWRGLPPRPAGAFARSKPQIVVYKDRRAAGWVTAGLQV